MLAKIPLDLTSVLDVSYSQDRRHRNRTDPFPERERSQKPDFGLSMLLSSICYTKDNVVFSMQDLIF